MPTNQSCSLSQQLGENDEQFRALEELLRRLHVTILQPTQDARTLYGFEVLENTKTALDMLEKLVANRQLYISKQANSREL